MDINKDKFRGELLNEDVSENKPIFVKHLITIMGTYQTVRDKMVIKLLKSWISRGNKKVVNLKDLDLLIYRIENGVCIS